MKPSVVQPVNRRVLSGLWAHRPAHVARYAGALVTAVAIETATSVFATYVYLRARLTGGNVVRVIGDSHVKAFRYRYPFIVNHLGAPTAHSLAAERSSTNSRARVFRAARRVQNSHDQLLLVFGEIDCRIHIYKACEEDGRRRQLSDYTSDTVGRYKNVVSELRALGVRVIVYGVAPAARQQNVYKYPFYGTPEVRSYISREFNSQLRRACEPAGIPYFDVQARVADANGFAKLEFAADEVHLKRKIAILVREWIETLPESHAEKPEDT